MTPVSKLARFGRNNRLPRAAIWYVPALAALLALAVSLANPAVAETGLADFGD